MITFFFQTQIARYKRKKKLTKEAVETLLNKLFSLDREQNENTI